MLNNFKSILSDIFQAGLAAVQPGAALQAHLKLNQNILKVGEKQWELTGRRIFVVGAGKGVAPMALALEQMLGNKITAGLVVTKYDHGLDLQYIELIEAGHPLPDAQGLQATARIMDMVRAATSEDLIIALFTGGASALTPAPALGLSLADLQGSTNLLLSCGANIQELNAVRKHLSCFSGGQLARLSQADMLALFISDVVGDSLDVISSGPTVADSSKFSDFQSIVIKYNLESHLPVAVKQHLQQGLQGIICETPKTCDPCFNKVHNVLIATNSQALQAAAVKATALGYPAQILTDTLTGEAKLKAVELIALAGKATAPVCLLAGGETTVTIQGSGLGGRNQEMALAASLALSREQQKIVALFAGTDGTDGPTTAAGGFAMALSAENLSLAEAHLANNNSNAFLLATDNLYITGPTRTNVMDFAIILCDPSEITKLDS